MSKPISSLSTAITIRIPNDLLETVTNYALAQGFLNESGRVDKRGQPNLSATITNLLKRALEHSNQETYPASKQLSDSVTFSQNEVESLEIKFASIENILVNRVCEVVTQRLNNFLSHHNTINFSIVENKVELSELPSEVKSISQISSGENFQETKEDTKERILNAASRGFRSQGYNGIGVNTLAKNAGVTSGAFYGYFCSKEDAFLATVIKGLEEYRIGIETFQADHGADWSRALADYYLGRQHREDLACGCALPTLSPEVIRSEQPIRVAYQSELLKLNEVVSAGLVTGDRKEKQDTAWVILAILSGGVTLARAVWDEDVAGQIATAIHQATVEIASVKKTIE